MFNAQHKNMFNTIKKDNSLGTQLKYNINSHGTKPLLMSNVL